MRIGTTDDGSWQWKDLGDRIETGRGRVYLKMMRHQTNGKVEVCRENQKCHEGEREPEISDAKSFNS